MEEQAAKADEMGLCYKEFVEQNQKQSLAYEWLDLQFCTFTEWERNVHSLEILHWIFNFDLSLS